MSIVVVGSVRGGVGVTTTSLLLASCMQALMVEADPAGGVMAVRWGLGREPGLVSWAAEPSAGFSPWRDHAQLAGGVPVLVEPDAPETAVALWRRAGAGLAARLAALDTPVVGDMGRLPPGAATTPLAGQASLAVVLLRPEPEHLVGFAHHLRGFHEHGLSVAVAVVGKGRYRAGRISAELGVPMLGVLPEDERGLQLLLAGGAPSWALRRTRLARAVRDLAEAVADHLVPAGERGDVARASGGAR